MDKPTLAATEIFQGLMVNIKGASKYNQDMKQKTDIFQCFPCIKTNNKTDQSALLEGPVGLLWQIQYIMNKCFLPNQFNQIP